MFLSSFSFFTWIYENRVSKYFVIYLNFPCLSLFTVLFAYMYVIFLVVFWLGICVEVAVDGILCISLLFTPPPPLSLEGVFHPYPEFSV